MLETAVKHINKVLKEKYIGSDRECEHYPCHFEGQDCAWCFCPFYPCLDDLTGGRFVISKKSNKKVWSCIDCSWIHEPKNSKAVLEELRKFKDINAIDQRKLREIRSKILHANLRRG
jgi:Zn-finger protein